MAEDLGFFWETQHQRQARLRFVETWKDRFTPDRLAGLAMVWLNMRFWGCRYPTDVENLVKDLETEAHISFPKRSIQIAFKQAQIIENLIIYEPPRDDPSRNPISVLFESTQKSKKSLSFEELPPESGEYQLNIFIENKYIATGKASNKRDAKRIAAENALEVLKPCQRVVHKRKLENEVVQTIARNELTKKAYDEAPSIPESNVGNQLLRKMGWTGIGGVGKKSQGITEPVLLLEADGRKGFGQFSQAQNLHQGSIKKVLFGFLNSSDMGIKFSSELSKEDRAEVHSLCRKFGLQHRSYGVGEDRFLVVTKKQY